MKISPLIHSFPRRGLMVMLLIALAGLAFSAEKPDPEKFEKESLALRTALHFDPSQAASLDRLTALYKEFSRLEELIGLYQGHLTEFPDDTSALIVLIQILRTLNDARAEALLATAMARQEENSLITYIQYQQWSAQQDPRALDTLATAITQEKNLARKRQWSMEFIRLAKTQGKEEQAKPVLERLIQENGQTAADLITLSREILGAGHAELARAALTKALTLNPDPESLLEAEVIAVRVDQTQGKFAEAAARMETLLAKVAADHWRRAELIQLRLTLTQNDAEKRRLLDKARARFEANPQDENAARELGELLQAADLPQEALAIFLAASRKFPHSEPLERQALDLLDRLGHLSDTEAFLKERVVASPARSDLGLRLVRTLFAAGKSEEARRELTQRLAKLPAEQRADRLVEIARQLRRNALPAEATGLLEQAVKSLPQRLDLRRELAETYLALGRRSDAGELFARGIDPNAPVEYATDVAQFLVGQNFFPEARRLLEAREAAAPLAFELKLILVDIHGQLGNFPEGTALLGAVRPQADTEARYASWLQAALKFHEAFARAEDFLKEEMAQVKSAKKSSEPWSPLQFQQFLLLCDSASHQSNRKMSLESLREILEDKTLAPEQADRVRGLLVTALSKDANALDEVQALLVEIMGHDKNGAMLDLNRLRLAQIYDKAQRGDLARQALEQARPEVIMESSDLAACWPLYLKYDLIDRAQAAIIRLTALDPGNTSHWEKRLSLQAKLGDETAFRNTIRQVLAGLKEIRLSEESLDQLRKHLEVSYWRDITRRLQNEETPDQDSLVKTLDDLQAIARSRALEPHETAWVLWVRAWVLTQLNRPEERDTTVNELQDAVKKAELQHREKVAQAEKIAATEKAAAQQAQAALSGATPGSVPSAPVPGVPNSTPIPEAAATADQAPAPPVIRFPDGLNLSLDSALSLLKEPTLRQNASPVASEGPAGSLLATAWSFLAPTERSIHQVLSHAAGKLVVIQDSKSGIAAVSLSSGKLLWQVSASGPEAAAPNPLAMPRSGRMGRTRRIYTGGGNYYSSFAPYQSQDLTGLAMHRLPSPLALLDEQLFAWEGDAVVCRDLRTGQVLWEAEFTSKPNDTPSSPPPMVTGDGRLYVAFPAEGYAVALDPKSGKVLWQSSLTGRKGDGAVPTLVPVYPLMMGMDYRNGLVLVYGLAPTLLEAATGHVRWSLEKGSEPAFPVALKSAASGEALLGLGKEKSAPWASTRNSAMMNGGQQPQISLAYSQLSMMPLSQFMQQGGKMVSLANSWLQPNQGPITGVLTSDRLILMTESMAGAFSLRLPMGGTAYSSNGMLLGTSREKLAFLNQNNLSLIDTSSEKTLDLPLKELGGPLPQLGAYQGCVSGSRVYVTGLKGIGVWQIHTGARIGMIPWPKEWEKEAGKISPLPKLPPNAANQYYAGMGTYYPYQGTPGATVNRRGSFFNPGLMQNGMSVTTIAPRCWVAGDTLITALSPELIIALRTPATP